MQNIYITEWIKVVYDATVASSLSREQRDTAKKKKVKEKNKIKTQQQEKVLGHSPGEPGMEFCNHGKSPRQTEIVFSVHDPKFNWIYFPHCEKKRTSRDNKT